MNMGNITGNIEGNVRDWASFGSLQVEPNAAENAPNMMIDSSMYTKNHGKTCKGT